MERERERGREGEGEVLCCWIIHLAIEPAAVWGWISAATDVCGVKIAGVGWWSAGGGDAGTKDMEKEREGEKERGEMDHPVSGCIMGEKREADEQIWSLSSAGCFLTHTRNCHKPEKLTTRKCPDWTIWLKPLCLLLWWPSFSLRMHNCGDLCFSRSMRPC